MQIGLNASPLDAAPHRRAIVAVAHVELAAVEEFQRSADAEQTAAGCGACADDYSAFPLLHRGGEDFGAAGRTRADQHDERPVITYLCPLGVTGGGAPLPTDEFPQAVAFREKITSDLGDGGDEAAAVIPQIENEATRPLRLPHRGVEIFLDLRPESRDLDVAEVIKRL